jgi:hypothetical protein
MSSSHCVALTREGELYVWGVNKYGALGVDSMDGTQTVFEPARVPAFNCMLDGVGRGKPCSIACGKYFTVVRTHIWPSQVTTHTYTLIYRLLATPLSCPMTPVSSQMDRHWRTRTRHIESLICYASRYVQVITLQACVCADPQLFLPCRRRRRQQKSVENGRLWKKTKNYFVSNNHAHCAQNVQDTYWTQLPQQCANGAPIYVHGTISSPNGHPHDTPPLTTSQYVTGHATYTYNTHFKCSMSSTSFTAAHCLMFSVGFCRRNNALILLPLRHRPVGCNRCTH